MTTPAAPEQTVHVEFTRPTQYSRGWAIAGAFVLAGRYIAAIPMLIVLYIFGIGAFFVAWFAQLSVVFRGEYPENSFDFLVRYLRWAIRVQAFILGMTDRYPSMDSMQP